MLSAIVQFPGLAAITAVVFWLLWMWRRSRLARACSIAWAVYCAYEYLMHARVLCSGECNIRIDLLLIYPALGVLSLLAILQSNNSRPRPDTHEGGRA